MALNRIFIAANLTDVISVYLLGVIGAISVHPLSVIGVVTILTSNRVAFVGLYALGITSRDLLRALWHLSSLTPAFALR